jgi:hypothetical protein
MIICRNIFNLFLSINTVKSIQQKFNQLEIDAILNASCIQKLYIYLTQYKSVQFILDRFRDVDFLQLNKVFYIL